MPLSLCAIAAAVVLAGRLAAPCVHAQASPDRTWRAAVDLSGRQRPLDLHLNAGFHHVVNAGHEEGRTVNHFEGRLQPTLGLSRRAVLR
jgi:hypothetical protein